MALEIMEAGPLTTVQDRGRRGFAAFGYQESGACDKYAMELGNILAGNEKTGDSGQAVLEFTLKGGKIGFTTREVIALTGADMDPRLNGSPIPMYCAVTAEPGDVLSMGTAVRGLRGYLAVYGGIRVPLVMGSRSTNLKCRIGGLEGRALQAGDVLETTGGLKEKKTAPLSLADPENEWLRLPSNPYRIMGAQRTVLVRAVPGPQAEAFTEEGLHTFERSFYRLTTDSNRMACRFSGPAVGTFHGSDIISDGIVEGSVQISSDGMPIVMLADHQTTGGYAKIGTVISTDIPALAQLRPGEQAAFKFVTPEEGIAACRREAEKLEWIRSRFGSAEGRKQR